jgi:plastocyanin
MRSRWIVILIAAGLLAVPLGAAAATSSITMADFSFSPQTATVAMGTTVQWSNTSTAGTPHTATQYTALHLWDTGTVDAGGSASKIIRFAGTYPYHCNFHYSSFNMVGTVKVPIAVSPASGASGTTFTVTLATVDAPSAFVYDVQKKVGKDGAWISFRKGVTTKSVTFKPSSAGTYFFRSQLRRVSNGGTSNWSPARSVTVS